MGIVSNVQLWGHRHQHAMPYNRLLIKASDLGGCLDLQVSCHGHLTCPWNSFVNSL